MYKLGPIASAVFVAAVLTSPCEKTEKPQTETADRAPVTEKTDNIQQGTKLRIETLGIEDLKLFLPPESQYVILAGQKAYYHQRWWQIQARRIQTEQEITRDKIIFGGINK